MVLSAISIVQADATYTELEVLPNNTDVKKGNQVTFSIYVTPQDSKTIDTVAIDNIIFTASKLQYVGSSVSWGNLFPDTTLQINGTVNNTAGTITDVVWGSHTGTSTAGYYCNLTFNTIATGTAYVNISGVGVANTPYGNETPDDMAWTINSNGSVLIHEYIPGAPTNLNIAKAGSYAGTQLNLSWTKGSDADYTYIEWNSTEGPWAFGEATQLYNGTGSDAIHSGLSEGTTRYYQLWSYNATDNEYSVTYLSGNETSNNVPDIANPSPGNNTGNQELSLNWQADITDADGESIDWDIECSNGQTNGAYEAGGTKSLSISGLDYSTTYRVWVNATDYTDCERQWFEFTTRDQYAPNPPSSFTATAWNTTQINLSWAKGANADRTYIEWNSAPDWSRGEGFTSGIISSNGTQVSTIHNNCDPHTTYYYQAWGWNETDGTFSSTNSSDDATTLNTAPSQPSTPAAPTNNSDYESVYIQYMNVTVSDGDSDNLDVSFYWSNDTLIATDSGVSSGGTASIYLPDYINPDWLDHNTTYNWYVNITDGHDIVESTVWEFITSMAWDTDEDRDVDYQDVSLMVANYHNSCTAGQYGWDILADGYGDYLDVSLLVTYYGDSY